MFKIQASQRVAATAADDVLRSQIVKLNKRLDTLYSELDDCEEDSNKAKTIQRTISNIERERDRIHSRIEEHPEKKPNAPFKWPATKGRL